MSGKKSRNKGSRGERELGKLLSAIVGYDCVRNLDQTRDGGADIISIPGIAIEVKRQEVLNLKSWWLQACSQAEKSFLIPVVGFRQNRLAWTFLVPYPLSEAQERLIAQKKDPRPYMALGLSVFELWLASNVDLNPHESDE